MRVLVSSLRRSVRKIVALTIVGVAFIAMYVAERPVVADTSAIAGQFKFSRHTLPEVGGSESRPLRATHPAFSHLAWYWSGWGAAAALSDLDGDGLPNDVCYVDTRTDQVIVAAAPGTGDRYKPFALNFNVSGAKLFDRSTMAPVGCLPGDVNEDGRIDLLVYFWGRTPLLMLSRRGDGDPQLGPESFVPVDIIPGGQIWVTGSATSSDLDGDGHLDLVFVNYLPDGSAALDPHATTPIYMPASLTRAYNGGGIRIYRCLPKEKEGWRTVECSEAVDALPADLPRGWGLAVGANDIDGDLLPELYVANDFGPDHLLCNRSTPGHIRFERVQGERTLNTPLSKVLGRDSFKGMGVDFADLNGDGVPDIFISNITTPLAFEEANLLFLSAGPVAQKLAKGIAPYVDGAEALGLARSGWAWDGKLDDFNNDGILEVVQGTGFIKGTVSRWSEMHEIAIANDELQPLPKFWPNQLPGDNVAGHQRNPFLVRQGGRYVDIAPLIGFGEDNPSRGIAIADVDGDGRLDMVVANMWGPSTYYHNECDKCGNFLGLHLRLPVDTGASGTIVRSGRPIPDQRSRPAIGAAVAVTTADGRLLTRQVDGGNGHSGKRSPDLHFGLGAQTAAVQVDVRWRDNSGQPRHETFELSPGSHTIILGSGGRSVSSL